MEKDETAGQMLRRLGMDGKLWAEEMHKRFPAIAEDDLLGWCCNMIMAGYDEAQRRATERESNEAAGVDEKVIHQKIFDCLYSDLGICVTGRDMATHILNEIRPYLTTSQPQEKAGQDEN